MSSNSLYPIYKNESGWDQLLPTRIPVVLGKNIKNEYSYVVVGAGYTGAAAARRLAELNPDEQILLCEAGTVGAGSSARNSGFMISEPHLVNRKGEDNNHFSKRSHKLLRLYKEGLSILEDQVKQHSINCDWQAVGKYHAAATSHGAKHLHEYLRWFDDWGVDYREMDADSLKDELGTAYYGYGYWTSHNVLVQPSALIRGLVDNLPNNVILSESTPVSLIRQVGDKVELSISGKKITAKTVLLATNGSLKTLGYLKDRLAIIYTYAGLTPELSPEQLKNCGAVKDWGILPAHRLGTTLRRVNGNRFLIRTTYSYEKERPLPEIKKILEHSYKSRFPQINNHDFEFIWGGTTALTRNGAFYLGRLDKNIFAAAGCNGVGILKGTAYGQLMADMAMGSQSSLLTDALSLAKPSWLPPEPIRSVALHSAIKYEKWRAGLEM